MRTPSLRRHKPSGLGVVTLSGKDFYLGAWPASQSQPPKAVRERYDRLVAEWLANGRQLMPKGDLLVKDVMAAYWKWAEKRYTHSTELRDLKYTLRPLRKLYASLPATSFGPLRLKALQHQLALSLTRGVVNQRIGRIKRMFRWAVAHELIPPSVSHALDTLPGLPKGLAPNESEPVRPIQRRQLRCCRRYLSKQLRTVADLQYLTAARAGELLFLRGREIEFRSSLVAVITPSTHKGSWRNVSRQIVCGRLACKLLRLWLRVSPEEPLFQPRESKRRRGHRETYTVQQYDRAIARACVRAGVEHWHPHQLRHTALSRVRANFGPEHAQAVAGHSHLRTTEIYAKVSLQRSLEVMKDFG